MQSNTVTVSSWLNHFLSQALLTLHLFHLTDKPNKASITIRLPPLPFSAPFSPECFAPLMAAQCQQCLHSTQPPFCVEGLYCSVLTPTAISHRKTNCPFQQVCCSYSAPPEMDHVEMCCQGTNTGQYLCISHSDRRRRRKSRGRRKEKKKKRKKSFIFCRAIWY